MNAFEFMANAFFVSIGIICLSAAALFVYSFAISASQITKKQKAKQKDET